MNNETPKAEDKTISANTISTRTESAEQDTLPAKKGLNPLLIMLLVFGLPYALAWYFLYGGDPSEFEAPNNNGEIISPMVQLPEYNLKEINGKDLTSQSLSGKWLLFTYSKECGEACKRTLLVIRQSRKAMAVDREVIKPILLLENDSALEDTGIDFEKDFSALSIISSESTKKSGLLGFFSANGAELENSIFMVDPYGNFMMQYPADSDQLGLLDDMKRLLKVNPAHR